VEDAAEVEETAVVVVVEDILAGELLIVRESRKYSGNE
jgi:hypothetical protein